MPPAQPDPTTRPPHPPFPSGHSKARENDPESSGSQLIEGRSSAIEAMQRQRTVRYGVGSSQLTDEISQVKPGHAQALKSSWCEEADASSARPLDPRFQCCGMSCVVNLRNFSSSDALIIAGKSRSQPTLRSGARGPCYQCVMMLDLVQLAKFPPSTVAILSV